jgi:hypothetical protein
MAIKIHWAGTRTRGRYTHADVECDSCGEKVSIPSGGYLDITDHVHEQLRERGWEQLEGVNDKGRTVEWDVCKSCLEEVAGRLEEEREDEERRALIDEQNLKYGGEPPMERED